VTFTYGPAWAAGTRCCGKPVGCTNMSDDCVMRHHPWKARNVADPPGIESDPDPADVPGGPAESATPGSRAQAPKPLESLPGTVVTADLTITGGLLLSAAAIGLAWWCWVLLGIT
jgi:hypothetical protein